MVVVLDQLEARLVVWQEVWLQNVDKRHFLRDGSVLQVLSQSADEQHSRRMVLVLEILLHADEQHSRRMVSVLEVLSNADEQHSRRMVLVL